MSNSYGIPLIKDQRGFALKNVHTQTAAIKLETIPTSEQKDQN